MLVSVMKEATNIPELLGIIKTQSERVSYFVVLISIYKVAKDVRLISSLLERDLLYADSPSMKKGRINNPKHLQPEIY